ncbi:hypothetical protein F2Q69_00015248 [Brassica cretica]|uniref:Uncharacterized protein n=1 Tax=Brassica cretica TaxID=69181 RepID=A0A8S9QVR0_BRACR|nr:hypothetical protein F2Q69_00015248 [Brassica cretica]
MFFRALFALENKTAREFGTTFAGAHGDVYLGAVPVPETFRGRVLHGDSTGTAWGRLENIAMSKTSFHGT